MSIRVAILATDSVSYYLRRLHFISSLSELMSHATLIRTEFIALVLKFYWERLVAPLRQRYSHPALKSH